MIVISDMSTNGFVGVTAVFSNVLLATLTLTSFIVMSVILKRDSSFS